MESWRETFGKICDLGALVSGVYVTTYFFNEILPQADNLGKTVLAVGTTILTSAIPMMSYNHLYKLMYEDSISVSRLKLD